MSADLVAIESRLWAAADQLWANTGLRPADFSEPVLGLIFLRYADKRFEEARAALIKKGFDEDELEPHDFQAEGVVYLPDHARFSYLLQLTEGDDVGKALNEAMLLIEGGNADLKGVLPRSYNRLPNATLVELLRLLSPLDLEGDAFGKVYEYFLGAMVEPRRESGPLSAYCACHAASSARGDRFCTNSVGEASLWFVPAKQVDLAAHNAQWVTLVRPGASIHCKRTKKAYTVGN